MTGKWVSAIAVTVFAVLISLPVALLGEYVTVHIIEAVAL